MISAEQFLTVWCESSFSPEWVAFDQSMRRPTESAVKALLAGSHCESEPAAKVMLREMLLETPRVTLHETLEANRADAHSAASEDVEKVHIAVLKRCALDR